MIARLALAAALLGSAAGATAVLAAGDAPTRPRSHMPTIAAAPTGTAVPTAEPLILTDTPRVVFETPDPEGGAPWTVRRFSTTQKRRHGGTEPTECWELGRSQGDRFGWIDGHGTFKPVRAGRGETVILCSSPKLLRRIGADRVRVTTVEYPPGHSPEPARTVVFAVAAPDVTAIEIDGGRRLPIGPERVVLQVARGEASGPLTGAIERRDGTRERFTAGEFPRTGDDAPVAGSQAVAARAPDPAGGEPWGVIVRRGSRGGLCVDVPGRLVGTQLGSIDRRLDIFFAWPLARFICKRAPTRAEPLQLDALISGTDPSVADTGRVERRTLPGRIVYWGPVHPDVVSVTLRTPRDVRTLIPTQPHHMVLAVYDGLFPGGKVTATARLRDGTEVTRSLHVE